MTKPIKNILGEKEKVNNRQLEAQLVQKPFAKALRQMIASGYIYKLNPDLLLFRFTSTAGTWAGDARKGAIQKDMGYQAGWFDLTFLWRFKGRRYEIGLIECKFGDGDYSDSQKPMHADLAEHEIPHAKIYRPQEGYEVLKLWGIKV